jgi:DNA-binding ferritin-like protein
VILGQILLSVIKADSGGYKVDVETNIRDTENIKKILRETLELLGNEPDPGTEEVLIETYTKQ